MIETNEENDASVANDLTKFNEVMTTHLVPQITDKGDLITLFKNMVAPMSDALEKSEKMITEARPLRTSQNSE